MSNNNFIRFVNEQQQQSGVLNTLRRRLDGFLVPILWTIFDLANLNCLCQIANEFVSNPLIMKSVKDYFSKHYRGKEIRLIDNDRRPMEYLIYFKSSVQQARLFGMNVNTFNNVALNFPHLTKITFDDKLYQNLNAPSQRADILANTMRMVQTVVFNVHQFKGAIFDRLLEHAMNNIRILIINSTTTNPNLNDNFEVNPNRWYARFYPNLTTLQWDDGITSNPLGFQHLLRNNSNIRHLMFTRNISLVLDFIEASNLQLLRLDVKILKKDLPNITSIRDRLNQLFGEGHFTQLFISCDIFRLQFNTLQGLRGITYNGEYIIAIGEITQLTDLTIDYMDNGLNAAIHLNELRNLCINRASIETIKPFICESPNITKIVIKNVEDLEFLRVPNFHFLAQQRERLPNAKRLKIYLEEKIYCVLKPYETEFSKNWVVICRIDELLN